MVLCYNRIVYCAVAAFLSSVAGHKNTIVPGTGRVPMLPGKLSFLGVPTLICTSYPFVAGVTIGGCNWRHTRHRPAKKQQVPQNPIEHLQSSGTHASCFVDVMLDWVPRNVCSFMEHDSEFPGFVCWNLAGKGTCTSGPKKRGN